MLTNENTIYQLLGETDIYLIDQLMKGRYGKNDKILDAGCGTGRNIQWFLQHNYAAWGCDINAETISQLKKRYPRLPVARLVVSTVENMAFADNYFDHVISSAVLHFAKSTAHFKAMLEEMTRVLKPAGSLFIRMTSDIGIEDKVKLLGDGVYHIPDGSTRFLVTRPLLEEMMRHLSLSFIEPLKTVNVNDVRSMSTLVLRKN